MSRQDQYNVTVTIDGIQLGTFDTFKGGEIDSEETKYKQGGMVPEISLGGSISVSNIILERLYVLVRDHPQVGVMKSKVGKGEVIVVKQPLDINAVPFGAPIVYQGKLKKYSPPPTDSMAKGTPALLTIEVSTAGIVS